MNKDLAKEILELEVRQSTIVKDFGYREWDDICTEAMKFMVSVITGKEAR